MVRSVTPLILLFAFLAAKAQQGVGDYLLFVTPLEREVFSRGDAEKDPLLFLMAYDSRLDSGEYLRIRNDLDAFTDKLGDRRNHFRSDVNFIRFVFKKIRARYLQQYVTYGSFNELFYLGNYNCLSGTALYEYILSGFGFHTQIFETRYHSFLTVVRQKGPELLIEATDPRNGLVKGRKKVLARIAEYQRKESTLKYGSDTLLLSEGPILTRIHFKELAALHYFNLAVVKFNKAEYVKSISFLRKAEILYPDSERIKGLLFYAYECSVQHPLTKVFPKNNANINFQTSNLRRK